MNNNNNEDETQLFAKRYMEFTRTTAIYNEEKAGEYLAFGFADESGEVLGVYKKWMRDKNTCNTKYQFDDETKENLIKEAGDVMWYIARICDTFGIDFSWVVSDAKRDFFDLPDVAEIKKDQDVPTGDFVYFLVELNNCANRVLNCYPSIENSIDEVKISLNDAVFAIMFLLACANISTIEYAMERNIEKLQSRKDRNKLSGSGDNR